MATLVGSVAQLYDLLKNIDNDSWILFSPTRILISIKRRKSKIMNMIRKKGDNFRFRDLLRWTGCFHILCIHQAAIKKRNSSKIEIDLPCFVSCPLRMPREKYYGGKTLR